uniref:24 kDa protein n=1 Tax=Anisakis simplex TaxID=6269 RepID=G1FMP3_ANISI|nr:24 kDa protein [Anisakis simplex]
MIRILFTFALTAFVCNAQEFKRQCQCSEVRPCKDKAIQSVEPCADKCGAKEFLRNSHIDFNTMRTCIMQYRPQIVQSMQCSIDTFKDACSQGPTNRKVKKLYASSIEIAIMGEINQMITVNQISGQVAQYVAIGRKYANCVQKCIERRSTECQKANDCGLALPQETVIAKTIKNCAVRSGLLTTQVAQTLCNCAVRAGARSLAPVCPTIIIQ